MADTVAVGVLALAFPLLPPWRPESSRVHELPLGRPVLVIQGGQDTFGRPTDFIRLPGLVSVASVPFADHEFSIRKGSPITQREGLELLNDHTQHWLDPLLIRESAAAHGCCRQCDRDHLG